MQRDPLGYVDGMNLMEYVGSNPKNYLDIFGLNKTHVYQNTSSISARIPLQQNHIRFIHFPGSSTEMLTTLIGISWEGTCDENRNPKIDIKKSHIGYKYSSLPGIQKLPAEKANDIVGILTKKIANVPLFFLQRSYYAEIKFIGSKIKKAPKEINCRKVIKGTCQEIKFQILLKSKTAMGESILNSQFETIEYCCYEIASCLPNDETILKVGGSINGDYVGSGMCGRSSAAPKDVNETVNKPWWEWKEMQMRLRHSLSTTR